MAGKFFQKDSFKSLKDLQNKKEIKFLRLKVKVEKKSGALLQKIENCLKYSPAFIRDQVVRALIRVSFKCNKFHFRFTLENDIEPAELLMLFRHLDNYPAWEQFSQHFLVQLVAFLKQQKRKNLAHPTC